MIIYVEYVALYFAMYQLQHDFSTFNVCVDKHEWNCI